jgi:Flp pilus assembly protein protease CpaA
MVASLPLVLFPFCLIAAALSDARRFIIPNELCAALVIGFAIAAFLVGMDAATLGNHVLTAVIVLAAGFGLFCINVFGAGDGKLLARRVPSLSARFRPLATLAATETLKCPYGIAICIGTLLTFRRTPIFEALIAQVL